jgi:membrane protein
MAPLKERASTRVAALREQRPSVDHVVRALGYYSERNGNGHAGAVTFFAFLSFFPLLALAFFVVGYISAVAPDVRSELVDAIETVFPGLVGDDEGQLRLSTFEKYAGTIGLIGLVALLYTGLAWVSAMRRALGDMFQLPETDQLGFVPGKLRDLVALVVLGVVLVVSVSLSGAMTWFSEAILEWLGLDDLAVAEVVLWIVALGLAVAATTVLFMALFGLVPHPHVASRAMWQGALTGALGFEVLKSVAGTLIAYMTERPAFQAFGVSLILLVWINYFSRLVMLSAAWAYTAPIAEQVRALEEEPLLTEEEGEALTPAPAAVVAEDPEDADLPRVRLRRRRIERIGVLSFAGLGAVAALTWLGRRLRH